MHAAPIGARLEGRACVQDPAVIPEHCVAHGPGMAIAERRRRGARLEIRQIGPCLVELLGNAWKAAKRDENNFAALSEVGNIAGNRSSFDVRNYGFARLSDLIVSLDQFQIERRDNQVYIKRLR